MVLDREMEAYVLSYRDNRDKGGQVIYNLLIVGLGVTLPVSEMGLTMDLGDTVVARVSIPSHSRASGRLPWGNTACDRFGCGSVVCV